MALTDNYTFQLSDTGVVLNTDVSLPFVDINRVIGLSSPEFRETSRQHEGQDGAFMDAEFEQGRNVILEGDVYAAQAGLEDYLDLLKANFAPSETIVPFYLLAPGQAERVVFVKPLGIRYDWQQARRTGTVTRAQFLTFAEDPRIYSSTLQSVLVGLAEDASTGFGFPLGFSFGFGASSMPNATSVVNNGNRPTPPIFSIPGPVIDPRIINDATGQTLDFALEVQSGQTLVVDVVNRTVRLDGSNRRDAVVRDEWFFLKAGTTSIIYRATSSSAPDMTVQFRDAWR